MRAPSRFHRTYSTCNTSIHAYRIYVYKMCTIINSISSFFFLHLYLKTSADRSFILYRLHDIIALFISYYFCLVYLVYSNYKIRVKSKTIPSLVQITTTLIVPAFE